MSSDDVDRVVSYARTVLPDNWTAWPGGWPDEVEAALLDAVLSIRARYGGPETGVRGAVARWRSYRAGAPLDDLTELAGCPAEELARILDNHQKVSGGASKAAAIVEAAQRLGAAGVRHAGDVNIADPAQRDAYTDVRGLGEVTWAYFGMLLRGEGVKADTWVTRFLQEALERSCTTSEAEKLMTAAAAKLGASATAFDHAVWDHMRRSEARAPGRVPDQQASGTTT